MVSVPFCNLGDAYGDNWNKKSNNSSSNTASNTASNISSSVLRNIKELEKEEGKVIPNAQNVSIASKNTSCPNCQQNSGTNVQYIPNIPTFQNAAGCMNRNNRFQNQVAQSQFELPVNPLNVYPGSFPPATKTLFPPYGLEHPSAQLPVFNQGNIWPAQRWYPDPNGPMAYGDNSPYNQMYNPVLYRQFNQSDGIQKVGDKYRENFGLTMGGTVNASEEKAVKLLQLILFVLVALFIIQLFELILRMY